MDFTIQLLPVIYGSRTVGTDLLTVALSKNLVRKTDISENKIVTNWRPITNRIKLSFKTAKKTGLFKTHTVFNFEILVKLDNFNRLFELGYLGLNAKIYTESKYIDANFVKTELIELQVFLTEQVWKLLKNNSYNEEKVAEILQKLANLS